MTACRRRVAALWSQFPPDNKNKRGNRARQHALHRLGSTTPLCGTLLWFLRNVARNSPTHISSFEIASLELQRFGASQKVRAPELRASFGLRGAWIEFLCSVVGPTRSSWCPGRINPHAYLRTHTQNHGSTCANGARTTARPHAPTKIPTFPHQKAKKSPFQQHVVSYNPPRAHAPARAHTPRHTPTSAVTCTSGNTKTPEPQQVPGSGGGGWGIRTPEGLHPTRFPSVRHRPLGESSVHIVPDNHKRKMSSRANPGQWSRSQARDFATNGTETDTDR